MFKNVLISGVTKLLTAQSSGVESSTQVESSSIVEGTAGAIDKIKDDFVQSPLWQKMLSALIALILLVIIIRLSYKCIKWIIKKVS